MGSGVDRRVIAVALAVPVLVLVGFVVRAVRDDGPAPATPTTTAPAPPSALPVAVDEAWNDDLAGVLAPLATVLGDLAGTVDAWATGEVGDGELRALLDRVEPVTGGVRHAAGGLEPHPGDPLAKPLVIDCAELYVRSVEAHRLALGEDDGLRTQYDVLGRRLRILADRVFDRARERTSEQVDHGDGVSVVPPAEVPDWERLEIAAGPPLVEVDPNRADQLPRSRVEDRPSQPERSWLAAVRDLAVPSADEVRAEGDDEVSLAAIARRLVTAAEALREVPVPDGDRNLADRVALGWLIRADAARARQIGLLARSDRRVEGAGDPASGLRLADALLSISEGAAFQPS